MIGLPLAFSPWEDKQVRHDVRWYRSDLPKGWAVHCSCGWKSHESTKTKMLAAAYDHWMTTRERLRPV